MESTSLLLTDGCLHIREARGWKSESRIVGEAIENCIVTMPCPVCNKKALVKYAASEKSKDVRCDKCGCQFQIKGTKTHSKKMPTVLKLLGAEYKTTRSSIQESNVHYIIMLYSQMGGIYTVDGVYFVDRDCIDESCIVPRTPLSSTARRAGWQGCTLVFKTFKPMPVR